MKFRGRRRAVSIRTVCRGFDAYERVEYLGQGSYGKVYHVRDMLSKGEFAVKVFNKDHHSESVPQDALREIDVLKSVQHPNIIRLREVIADFTSKQVGIVMEKVDCDLLTVIESAGKPFTQSEVKTMMFQLLNGAAVLHRSGWIHCDIKPSNILWSRKEKLLKICDFGFAEPIVGGRGQCVEQHGTRWYRAPELLEQDEGHRFSGGPPIDMWAVGCVFAEILQREALFPGENTMEQRGIVRAFHKGFEERVRMLFGFTGRNTGCNTSNVTRIDEAGVHLLMGLLARNPKERCSAAKAWNHRWFEDRRRTVSQKSGELKISIRIL
mmetsp:Transcript_439/g.753  ORF Transcript_439/g.753 Transcript_439/m.753 type:complete len:324 (+) Transcript_439:141-1112(+)